MGVIFMSNHMIWLRLQCAHIHSLTMHLHTENVYFGVVMNIHVSIFLTKKEIISIQKQHPQYRFTFITSLHVVLLMVEFCSKKKKFICVNKNLSQMNLEKYTPEKS